jgi:hypothetical protein
MGTTDCLKMSIQHTHDGLAERLDAARSVIARPEETRRGCPPIDLFCVDASRHLHAVDEVLLPSARVDGDYRAAEHTLGVVLTHLKAHEFGSTYEKGFDWSQGWGEVEDALSGYRTEEDAMVDWLTESLPDERLTMLTERLELAERRGPTRPHPYLPHIGMAGRMARRVERVADSFWDAVEGRYVPEPERPAKKEPGLIGQYLLADPRFDEEE